MSYLWTIEDMLVAMHGRPVGVMPDGITGISIDSRSIGKGEAFFAIKGDRVDGHDFAAVAMANGAAVLVVAEGKLPAIGRLIVPKIVVDDVLQALERLGAAARERMKGRVIAVTGSVGKTTTKEMLRHVLAPSGKVHASVASFNNHWGVPLTLARMPADTRFGIFEIGMNHSGEIRPLVKLVRPHIGIITTVAAAHLGNFANLEEIAEAKAELVEGIVPGGTVILNRDNPYYNLLQRKAQEHGVEEIVSFGENGRADFRLVECSRIAEGSSVWASFKGETHEFVVGAPGSHIAQNAMAVLAAADRAGADLERTIAALASLKPEEGRGRQHRLTVPGGTVRVIDESYNANPASMRASIALLAGTEPEGEGRRIAVLGDMLEMGEQSKSLHAALAEPLLSNGIDVVWLAGPDMAALNDALPDAVETAYRATASELSAYVLDNLRAGDVLMIKSSKGTGFSKIVASLLEKFPAAEAVGV